MRGRGKTWAWQLIKDRNSLDSYPIFVHNETIPPFGRPPLDTRDELDETSAFEAWSYEIPPCSKGIAQRLNRIAWISAFVCPLHSETTKFQGVTKSRP